MYYLEMIKSAKESGKVSEKQMWNSIENISNLLCDIKEVHPDLYWDFMRDQAGIINGNHYDEAFALYDVSMIRYSDRTGKKCEGGYWTLEQIENSTKGMTFPAGTTKWDKYVAFNSFYADTCTVLEEESIIKTAHKFYFMDEDGPQGKIWISMEAMYEGK